MTEVKITKLPPGKAFGADDLTKWSHNRSFGRFGTGSNHVKEVIHKCKKCGFEAQVIAARYGKTKGFICRKCGQAGQPIVKHQKKRRS